MTGAPPAGTKRHWGGCAADGQGVTVLVHVAPALIQVPQTWHAGPFKADATCTRYRIERSLFAVIGVLRSKTSKQVKRQVTEFRGKER